MSECVFCKIINKEIPSNIVLETERFIAFTPLHSSAPIHVLCIPKNHIEKSECITGEVPIWQDLFNFTNQVIEKFGLDKTGYRIVNNGAGYHGVNHEHVHVLGGADWKPGDDL